jgi:hypothetical protein
MSSNVIAMKSGVVEVLEDLLEKAKQGQIDCIGYIVSKEDEFSGNGWAISEKTNRMVVLGEIRCLERDFMDREIELRINPETGESYET